MPMTDPCSATPDSAVPRAAAPVFQHLIDTYASEANVVPFFDPWRERVRVFRRRVLHIAHHRAQLAVYLRLLGKLVPPTCGPTADVTWEGPTRPAASTPRVAPETGALL